MREQRAERDTRQMQSENGCLTEHGKKQTNKQTRSEIYLISP